MLYIVVAVMLLLLAYVFLFAPRRPLEQSVAGKLSDARSYALDVIVRGSRAGDVVVFDFDDTLFDPDKVVDVTHMDVSSCAHSDTFGSAQQAVPIYAPIEPMMDVLRFALSQKLDVVILTARTHDRRMLRVVSENLRRQGVSFSDRDLYTDAQTPTSFIVGRRAAVDDRPTFKAHFRKRLSLSRRIILTIGDRWTDVDEPGGAAWIKLPAKDDHIMVTSKRPL